jgi:hypothetical protein
MQFTDTDLREFTEIWQEEFHEPISEDEARHAASLLMDLYMLLATPLPAAPPRSSEGSLSDHRI